ncbi:MAG: hypothetical protein KF869_03600 [Phycisphaeraceae bacterium]|nr:hypothetical protein [Phycisphaeraceae bacterium]
MSRSSGSRMFVAVAAMLLTGCHGKLLRENVLATTQTAIGLSLAQNAQTQMYEAKLGYFRNEFFLVPTSKRVVYDADNKDAAGTKGCTATACMLKSAECNDPSKTPEVLAEIQVGGSGKQTFKDQTSRVDVYQRLAVGRIAVQSKAAVALMSKDPAAARALTLGAVDASSAEVVARIAALAHLESALEEVGRNDPNAKLFHDKLNLAARNLAPPVASFERYQKRPSAGPPELGKNLHRTISSTAFANFVELADYAQSLSNSMEVLKDAVKHAGPTTVVDQDDLGRTPVQMTRESLESQLALQLLLAGQVGEAINGIAELPEAIKHVFGLKCEH